MALSTVATIDGAHGEGGGALLRTALVMSALTGIPVRVSHVRGGTKFPGVDSEDVALANALALSCRADCVGFERGSNEIEFTPTQRCSGFRTRIGAVGSEERSANVLVLLSAIAPLAARSGRYSTFSIEGETYGSNALGFDAFEQSTASVYQDLGLHCAVSQVNAGFGRESCGLINVEIEPSVLTGIDWSTRGALISAHAVVVTSDLSRSIGQRAAGHVAKLAQSANIPLTIEQREVNGRGPGTHCTCVARYETGCGSGSAIGARGLRAEAIAQQAFQGMFEWMRTDSTIDAHLADQILIPLCVAEGGSVFKVSKLTSRFLTQIWVVKQFAPIRITVRGTEGEPGLVTIER